MPERLVLEFCSGIIVFHMKKLPFLFYYFGKKFRNHII